MHSQTLPIRTEQRNAMIDITPQVSGVLAESGVTAGLVHVFVAHTTAGVTINENADPDVLHDVLAALDAAVPRHQPFYRHGEGNSAAHVKSSLVGSSVQVPVRDGAMALGRWQGIYFCEFDGPRSRQVVVSVLPA